jgi:exosome complex RNA-binding protein Rrp42 (RNase PH superfamily)
VTAGPTCRPSSERDALNAEARALSSWLTKMCASAVAPEQLSVKLESATEGGVALNPAPRLAWTLFVHVYCLSFDGNLRDACMAAVLSALAQTRLPRVSLVDSVVVANMQNGSSVDGDVATEQLESVVVANPVLSATFAAIGNHVLADPTAEEERMADALLIVVVDGDGLLCGVTKTGMARVFTDDRVRECIRLAKLRADEILAEIAGIGGGT